MSKVSTIKKIGITGTIGSGKSAVLSYLKDKGFPCFSSDQYVHTLYDTSKDLANSIQSLTSQEVLSEGLLDRAKLKEVFFENESFKEQVESLVHKLVLEEITQPVDELTFYEVPLLFEVKWQQYFDETWCVVVSDSIRYSRLKEFRGLDKEEVFKRMSYQLSQTEKIQLSDIIFINDGSLNDLYQQIDRYLERSQYDIR